MIAITKKIVTNFKLYDLGYDFMGYSFKHPNDLTFHHLLIPRKLCKNVPDEGYVDCNGVVLVMDSSHRYLHVIEKFDNNLFCEITSELLDEYIKGRIDDENIFRIHELLENFEEEYDGMLGMDNMPLIKSQYLKRVLKSGR